MTSGVEQWAWWQRAEDQRAARERRLRAAAQQRLRRLDEAAQWRRALDGPAVPSSLMLDTDRLSGTLSQRLGVRGMIQLLLWGLMAAVGAITLVSFFTAPLMELDLAVKAVLAVTLLALSYIL